MSLHNTMDYIEWLNHNVEIYLLKKCVLPADLASWATSLRFAQRRTNGTMKEMADEMKRKIPANQKGTS